MELGKFEILEELGRGSYGIVYKARDKALNRLVAIKVLHTNLVNDPSFLSRFKQEAQISARLNHPNLVPVYDFDEANGHYFIVMGYMGGGSLKDLINQQGPLSKERALQILEQIAEGLAYAHQHEVIHRDLKPANILFDDAGNARICDMGLAKLLHSDSTESMSASSGLVGTPAYIAPEVWQDLPATAAADIYSIACILVEMLTATPLFQGASTPGIMLKHFQPLNLPKNLPIGWKPVIEKALAKTPSERTKTIQELVASLREVEKIPIRKKFFRDEVKNKKRPAILLVGGSLVLVILLAMIVLVRGALNGPALPTAMPQAALEQSTASIQLSPRQTQAPTQPPSNTSTPEPSATPAPTATAKAKLVVTKVRPRDEMVMVFVPNGTFTMGQENGEPDESPLRQVYLDSYWIDMYEVTVAQYKQCVAAEACKLPSLLASYTHENYYESPTFANNPVVNVSWAQAQEYCQWTGSDLPTEAQWEKAARGTDGNLYPWGDDAPNSSLANYGSINGDTLEVGSYPSGASPYGAMDMVGNVYEWVRDWYGPYDKNATKNPTGSGPGSFKVLRGCGWFSVEGSLRVSNRTYLDPATRDNDIGFRCIQEP